MTRPIFDEPQGNRTDPAYITRSRRWMEGDAEVKSQLPSQAYRDGWDRIWGRKRFDEAVADVLRKG